MRQFEVVVQRTEYWKYKVKAESLEDIFFNLEEHLESAIIVDGPYNWSEELMR